MSETVASLRHKIVTAGDLEAVVRTMKAMAASSIGQYENAVHALDDYYRTVQLGLRVCLQQQEPANSVPLIRKKKSAGVAAIVFGSDQGLVGQFNDVMVAHVIKVIGTMPEKKHVLSVGERIYSRLEEADLKPEKNFTLPNSIQAITSLVGLVLIEMESLQDQGNIDQIYLFYNRPKSGAIYTPVNQRILPLDESWRSELAIMRWPTANLPEVMSNTEHTLHTLVREYLFVSLFRACAESLASENASRLAAMQRAEKNIDELLEELNRKFHRLRQSGIDEELFDVVSGFVALEKNNTH